MTEGGASLSFDAPGGMVVVALVCAVAVVLFALSVREAFVEVDSPRRRAGILALHVLGIVGGALLALQPIWLEPRVDITPGRLAVLFDGSRSMGVGDEARSRAAEARALARRWSRETDGPAVSTFVFDADVRASGLEAL
ncbi:MAG: hypothetical protein H5U40_04180, partial [Polyangiaceae bacterium]|nr:hypothetical protein [Polyangiaceae bacterium]